MFIKPNLTKEGFLQLKKDRQKLLSQISELQSVLDDFNFVFPFLESIYEPKVYITEKNGKYYGEIYIYIVSIEDPIKEEFEIGKVSDYRSKDNADLTTDAYSKANDILKSKFPLHFS